MIEWLPFAAAVTVGAVVGTFLDAWINRLSRAVGPAEPSETRAPSDSRHAHTAHAERLGARRVRRQRSIVVAMAILMFGVGWWYYGLGLLLISRLALGCALIVLFVVDLRHHRLPNAVTLPGILAGFLFSLFSPPGWPASLLGIVLGGGLLWLVGELQYRIRGHVRLGMGDAKMLAMIGAFMGWPLTLVALVLALCAGSLISVGLIAFRRDGLPPVLPFGTFLAVGAVAAATVGAALVNWYVALW